MDRENKWMEGLVNSWPNLLRSLAIAVVFVVGFYFTTKMTVANNSDGVKDNKRDIEKVQEQLNEHEKTDFTKSDVSDLKSELIRELTNTQQQLQITNSRLDQVILYFKQEKQ